MEFLWKQQIKSMLKRRNQIQLGNYGRLVESYTQLLEQQDKRMNKRENGNEEREDQPKESTSSDTSNSQIVIQEASACIHCQDPQILKKEICMLLNQLGQLKREREHLLKCLIEEKEREAERMNHNNDIEERYQQMREKLRRIRAYTKSHCFSHLGLSS